MAGRRSLVVGSEPVAVTGSAYGATCQASFTAASSPEALDVGVPPWMANFGGAGSTSAKATVLLVAKAATSTSITASSSAPAPGAKVTYTATVAPARSGVAVPSGTVAFLDSGKSIGSCSNTPLSGSSASCRTT